MSNRNSFGIRELDWSVDGDALERFDASFTTDRIYELKMRGLAAEFVEMVVDEPICKSYDLSGMRIAVAESALGLVALVEGEIAGFMTVKVESWNRRAWLTHLYIDPSRKGIGIGTALVDEAVRFSRRREARGLFLETQNFNYPAIQFYLRRGFEFCGFDASLYDPSSVPGETAMYFSKVF